ncbi:hypothetical protein [Streptomyces filamentosus]
MERENEQPPAGQTRNRLYQVVVDWLVPLAAVAEFIEWVVTLW